jgi:hypothetical protein
MEKYWLQEKKFFESFVKYQNGVKIKDFIKLNMDLINKINLLNSKIFKIKWPFQL